MEKRNLIKLDEDETAQLIRLSTGGKVLSIAFGPSGAWLDANKSPWAAPLIADWRGITVNSGAGI